MISTKEKVLFLKPPPTGERNDGEIRKIKGFACLSCNGSGQLSLGVGYHGSEKAVETFADCKRCAGTGKLVADVVIRWTPEYSPKQLEDE